MTNPRITNSDNIKPGTVVQVAVQLEDKTTGQPYWWRRFGVVCQRSNGPYLWIMTLKLSVDPDKDFREVNLDKDVVTIVLDDQLPQGVKAMLMLHIHKGTIKLGED